MCFAPQRRALFLHCNFQKCLNVSCLAFSLSNVLRAPTACIHLSSGQLAPHSPLSGAYFSTLWSHTSVEKRSVARRSCSGSETTWQDGREATYLVPSGKPPCLSQLSLIPFWPICSNLGKGGKGRRFTTATQTPGWGFDHSSRQTLGLKANFKGGWTSPIPSHPTPTSGGGSVT